MLRCIKEVLIFSLKNLLREEIFYLAPDCSYGAESMVRNALPIPFSIVRDLFWSLGGCDKSAEPKAKSTLDVAGSMGPP